MSLRKGTKVTGWAGLAVVVASPKQGSVLIEFTEGEWKGKQARVPTSDIKEIKNEEVGHNK